MEALVPGKPGQKLDSAPESELKGQSILDAAEVASMHVSQEILNSNALISALFLTFEFALLNTDASSFAPTRRRCLLIFGTLSILSHTVCVYLAAEATFLFSKIKALPGSVQASEVRRFKKQRVWGSVEFYSGFSFLFGIVLTMVTQGIVLTPNFGDPDGTIALAVLVSAMSFLFAYAIVGVGKLGMAIERQGELEVKKLHAASQSPLD
eukprot:g64069.t1